MDSVAEGEAQGDQQPLPERLRGMKDDLGRRLGSVKEEVRREADRASEYARERYDVARDGLRTGYDRARKDFDHLVGDVNEYVKDNPGRSVLMAAGIGFLIGLLLRGGRRSS